MNPLRLTYLLILRLHPAPFRDRFAGEMLWIFDAEQHHTTLLLDGILSLARQHARGEARPQPTLAGFGLLDDGTGIAPRRFVEAGITATLLVAAVFLLLAHPPRSAALPLCQPGAPKAAPRTLHAPSRIQPLPVVATHLQTQSSPTQVNNAVAGALQFLRTQSTITTGYCAQP